MNKRVWIAVFGLIVLVFGSGFLLGRSNMLAAEYTNSYLTGQPKDADFSLFWEAWNALEQKYPFDAPTTEEKIYGAIQGLAGAYNDPYTVFFDPAEAKDFGEEISGSFGGVGMELGIKNDVLTVIAPLAGTPAEAAGVMAGDIITSIDGEPAYDLQVDEAVRRIRGQAGTEVTIEFIQPTTQSERSITLVREQISIPTLETETKGDVFIIRLHSFTEDSSVLFGNAMTTFQQSGKQKLIIDLRNNPGGYLSDAIEIASWFVPQGKVIVREDFGTDAEEIVYRSRGFASGVTGQNIIVLVNAGSASASEIVAGALQEQAGARLVGTETFGKGSVQELVPLSGKTSLKVTVARWLTPQGRSLSEESLQPNVVVDVTETDITEKRDPQLEKALELLK